MLSILNDWLTENDGKTFCPARALWVVGVIVFLGLSVYTAYRTGSFDYQAFGIGFGAALSGGGLAIKLKGNSSDTAATNG